MTETCGLRSHAEGFYTKAHGDNSHAQNGRNNLAHGENSHVQNGGGFELLCGGFTGNAFNEACGLGSHSEGIFTKACGNASHAEGYFTKALDTIEGSYERHSANHAEGGFTTADYQGAHAEGYGTVAIGVGAHAGGFGHIGDRYGDCTPNNHFNPVKACANGAFAHYVVSSNSATTGVFAPQGAILGGIDGHLTADACNSVLLGGVCLLGTSPNTIYGADRLELLTDLGQIVLKDSAGTRYKLTIVSGALDVSPAV
jgi:hypothetical protein